MKKYFAPLLLFTTLQSLQAKECVPPKGAHTTDLSGFFGPQRDQGGVGWCFANSAADQLDYYRYRKTKDFKVLSGENRISANYLATQYHQDIPWYESLGRTFVPSKLEEQIKECESFPIGPEKEACIASAQVGSYMLHGGRPNKVFEQTMEKGFCTVAQVPSEHFKVPDQAEPQDAGAYEEILGVIFREKSELIPEGTDTCDKIGPLLTIAPAARVEDIEAILQEYQGKDLVYNAYDLSCPEKDRKKIVPPPINESDYVSDLDLASIGLSSLQNWEDKNVEREKKIAELLDESIPVGVAVDLRLLTPRVDAEFLAANGLDPSTEWKDEGGLIKWGAIGSIHAMTIVGKKFNPKTCEYDYKIRNSWGTSCGPFIQTINFTPAKAKSQAENYKECRQDYFTQGDLDEYMGALVADNVAFEVQTKITTTLPELNINELMHKKFPNRPSTPEEEVVMREAKRLFLESFRVRAVERLLEIKKKGKVIPDGWYSKDFCNRKFPTTKTIKAKGVFCDPDNGELTVSASRLKMGMLGIDYLK